MPEDHPLVDQFQASLKRVRTFDPAVDCPSPREFFQWFRRRQNTNLENARAQGYALRDYLFAVTEQQVNGKFHLLPKSAKEGEVTERLRQCGYQVIPRVTKRGEKLIAIRPTRGQQYEGQPEGPPPTYEERQMEFETLEDTAIKLRQESAVAACAKRYTILELQAQAKAAGLPFWGDNRRLCDRLYQAGKLMTTGEKT